MGETERDALLRAFDSGWIAPTGPEVDAFEQELAEYVGAPACAALSSGSAGLELALLAVGVEAGDEVLVQTATFAASAFSVVHLGATPVFCDIEPDTWGLDPELVRSFLAERAATGRLPKAVMAVDIYGVCPRYDALRSVCDEFGVALVEDAAESLGSRTQGTMAGTLADVGVFSFNGNKIITTSGGGALVGSSEIVARVRYLSTQARVPGVAHYEHVELGFNYRMSNLLAALGRAQLAQLEGRIARRADILDAYRVAFPDLGWVPTGVTERPNCWLSAALLPDHLDPIAVCKELDTLNIEARPAWKPMHSQPIFAHSDCVGGAVADRLFSQGICLPSGSAMTDHDLDRVVASLRGIIGPDSTSSAPILDIAADMPTDSTPDVRAKIGRVPSTVPRGADHSEGDHITWRN